LGEEGGKVQSTGVRIQRLKYSALPGIVTTEEEIDAAKALQCDLLETTKPSNADLTIALDY
jgi:hypothetical protein